MNTERRRAADANLINKVTDNVYFRFAHQLFTLIAPILGAFFLHLYTETEQKLDSISTLLSSRVATYDEHFINTDQRITRLENRSDYTKGTYRD